MKSEIGMIWRKSVWDNNFKCTMCGRRLADKNGQPTKNTEFVDGLNTVEGEGLICKCGYLVACVKKLPEIEVGDNALKGDWSEYLQQAETAKNMMDSVKEEKRDLHNENVALKKQVKELESTVRAVKQKLEESRQKRTELAAKYEKMLADKEKEIRRLLEAINEG